MPNVHKHTIPLLMIFLILLVSGLLCNLLVYKDTGFPITYVPACDCPLFLTELARSQSGY